MSKPPSKTPGPRGPRKPARSDARAAASRPPRPRRDDAPGEDRPRKRAAAPARDPASDAPWSAPRDDRPERAPRGDGPKRAPRAADGPKRAPRGDGPKRAPRVTDGGFGAGKPRDGERPARARGAGSFAAGKEGGFAPRSRKPVGTGRDDAPRSRRNAPAPAPQTAPDPTMPRREGDRIAKVMARAGLCSRRDAELWIAEGRVAVNGRVLDTANVVVAEGDKITVDGHPLAKRERTRLFLFNKPRGLVTTDRDPEGRPTIFEAMPADLPRVVTIGRLDINTEGLLLLTNDGGLARVLELPSTGWLRRYRVRAHGDVDQARLDALRLGVTVDGVDYAGVEATLDRQQGSNVWLTMGLREGKNREVKRILEHLGLAVNRLIRVSYGPFQLGDLPEGAVEEVRSRHLKDQLGPQLAAEAGVDFDSPLVERDESEERVAPRRRIKWREDEIEEAAPRNKPAPAKRMHVSALRAERAAETERMRSERSQTEDRHGRVVAVERRMRAEPEAEAARKRKGPPRVAGDRDAERGRDMPRGPRDAGRPATGRTRGAQGRGPRRDDEAAPSRAPRRFSEAGAPARPRRFSEDGAPQRGEGYAPRPRGDGERSFAPRGEGERPARFSRDDRAGAGPRAPRGEGKSFGKPFAKGPRRDGAAGEDRPARRFAQDGERPARAPGGGFGGKSFGGKSFGAKPFRERSGEGRPFGDKPGRAGAPGGGGKSFGAKPGGGRPFGAKPGGGRPFGGKPGGKPFGGKPGGRGPSRGPGGPGRGPRGG